MIFNKHPKPYISESIFQCHREKARGHTGKLVQRFTEKQVCKVTIFPSQEKGEKGTNTKTLLLPVKCSSGNCEHGRRRGWNSNLAWRHRCHRGDCWRGPGCRSSRCHYTGECHVVVVVVVGGGGVVVVVYMLYNIQVMAPGLAIAGHRMLNSPVESNFPFHNIQHLKRLNLDAKFQFHYQDSHQN